MVRDDGNPAVEVDLQDNGLGADRVAGDGLYAKYFIDFLPNQQVKLQSKVSYFSEIFCRGIRDMG